MRMKKISVFMVHLLSQIQKLSLTRIFPKVNFRKRNRQLILRHMKHKQLGKLYQSSQYHILKSYHVALVEQEELVQKHVLAEKVKLIVVIAYLQRKDGVLTPVQMYFLKPLMRNALKTL